jgi:hypothetical protein
MFMILPRCTARADDLDGEAGRRSHEHTDLLRSVYDLKTLWSNYGIVGDVVVCFYIYI